MALQSPQGKLRILTSAGAIVLAGTLVACGGGGTAPTTGGQSSPAASAPVAAAPVTITQQVWSDTQYVELMADIYNDLHPEAPIVLDARAAGQNSAESVEAYRLALSAGKDIPDILQVNYDALPEFVDAGVIADITQYVEPYLDEVSPAGKTLMQYDGKYIAFPYEVKTKMWYYRSDMFEEAGIDADAVNTQDEFIEAGKKLKAKFPDSWIWNLGPKPQHYTWGMIVTGNGAQFSTKTPTCEFVMGTDPGTNKAFSALRELRQSGVVSPDIDDFTPEWSAGLADGTIASTLSVSWFPTQLKNNAPDGAGKWGVRTWPVIGDAIGGSQGAGSVFVISEASQNKEAAAKLLASVLLDPEGTQRHADAREGAWLPAVTKVLQSESMRDNPYFGPQLVEAFLASQDDYKIFPYDLAATKEQAAIQDALVNYFASGDADPSKYLQAAEDELNAQIGCPYTQ